MRLLSLNGPPRVGKARLDLGISQVIWPDFPDGVFFVALGSIRDPALVATAITQMLNVNEAGDRLLTDLLKSYIRNALTARLLLKPRWLSAVLAGTHYVEPWSRIM